MITVAKQGQLQNILNPNLHCLQSAGDKIKDAAGDVKDAVKDAAGTVKDKAGDAKDAIAGALSPAGS